MQQYVAWHYKRHDRYKHLIDRYFDPVAFDRELQALPGAFAAPSGLLLIGYVSGRPSGTVALRGLADGVGEMKRMFVSPEAQGHGLGRALAVRLIHEARSLGYTRLRLDTGPLQYEAHSLYASLGFVPIAPYGNHDVEMRSFLRFMELELHSFEMTQ
jgi:putative acetyltransferase